MKHPKKISILGASIAFAVLAVVYRLLSRFPDPPGTDGYFYLKQILSLGQSHTFYFQDRSLAFLMPAFIDLVSGDELLALRISIAAVLGAFAYLQWRIVDLVTEDSTISVRTLALSLVPITLFLNFPLYDLAFGYLKTMTALVFVSLTLLMGWQAVKTERGYWKIAIAALPALLSHKSSLLILSLIGVALLLHSRRLSWKIVATTLAVAALTVLSFTLLYAQGSHYLTFLLSGVGFWPRANLNWARELMREANMIHFTLISAVVFVFTYALQRRHLSSANRFLGDFLVLFSLITWLPFFQPGQDQPVYRIMLAYAALCPPLALALLVRLPLTTFAAGLIMGLQVAQFVVSKPLQSLTSNYSRFDNEVMHLKDIVGSADHLICHHGLEFYIDYKTNLRCQIFLSEDPAQTQYRMVYAPRETAWMAIRIHSEPKALAKLGNDYLLLKENDWQALVAEMKLGKSWRNPSDHRPGYIYAP